MVLLNACRNAQGKPFKCISPKRNDVTVEISSLEFSMEKLSLAIVRSYPLLIAFCALRTPLIHDQISDRTKERALMRRRQPWLIFTSTSR